MVNGRVLIYGGKGALGSVCLDTFAAKDWWTLSVDLVGNEKASANVTVDPSLSLEDQAGCVEKGVSAALNGNKLDAILCLAGGWAGGNTASQGFVKSCDSMIKQSLWTSIISARIASLFLKEGGLVQLTGAKAALESTSGMMGYGLSKAAVHQLLASLNSPQAGLPNNTTALAILPKLLEWGSAGPESRPAGGSLIELTTTKGQTDMVIGQLQQPSKIAQKY